MPTPARPGAARRRRRPSLVLVTGPARAPWTPRDAEAGRTGGAELAAAALARGLRRRGWRVTVVADTPGGTFGGVRYRPLADYDAVLARGADALVVSRYAAYLRAGPGIGRRYLWLHDVDLIGDPGPVDAAPPDGIVCLSHWHRLLVRRAHPGWPASRLVVSGHGLDPRRFAGPGEPGAPPRGPARPPVRVRRRFLYASCPSRGLAALLELWPAIRARFPDATLEIHADRDSSYLRERHPDQRARIEARLPGLAGVAWRGRVSQAALARAWRAADVWFYPTWFPETYCLTALEAQAGGCLCVCPPEAALAETVGPERGVLLPRRLPTGPLDEGTARACLGLLARWLADDPATVARADALRARARAWALGQTWDAAAARWDARLRRGGAVPAPV